MVRFFLLSLVFKKDSEIGFPLSWLCVRPPWCSLGSGFYFFKFLGDFVHPQKCPIWAVKVKNCIDLAFSFLSRTPVCVYVCVCNAGQK